MFFENRAVPCQLVQIANITNKDGSALAQDNWRRNRIGMVTMCWIAGGLNCPAPYFKGKIIVREGEIHSVDLFWWGTVSPGNKFPTEVEPGIFEFESTTSIYRLRMLAAEEEQSWLWTPCESRSKRKRKNFCFAGPIHRPMPMAFCRQANAKKMKQMIFCAVTQGEFWLVKKQCII